MLLESPWKLACKRPASTSPYKGNRLANIPPRFFTPEVNCCRLPYPPVSRRMVSLWQGVFFEETIILAQCLWLPQSLSSIKHSNRYTKDRFHAAGVTQPVNKFPALMEPKIELQCYIGTDHELVQPSLHIHTVSQRSAVVTFLACVRLEPRPRYWLFWLKIIMVFFFSLSRQMSE
jgi:hypothetical protein